MIVYSAIATKLQKMTDIKSYPDRPTLSSTSTSSVLKNFKLFSSYLFILMRGRQAGEMGWVVIHSMKPFFIWEVDETDKKEGKITSSLSALLEIKVTIASTQ